MFFFNCSPLSSNVSNPQVCELLLKEGKANVNARNRWRETPLHAAAYNAHANVCSALIAAGADVQAQNDQGKTPLDLAKAALDRGKFKKAANETIEVLRAAQQPANA